MTPLDNSDSVVILSGEVGICVDVDVNVGVGVEVDIGVLIDSWAQAENTWILWFPGSVTYMLPTLSDAILSGP